MSQQPPGKTMMMSLRGRQQVHESRVAFDDREDEPLELGAFEGERMLDRSHDLPLRREQAPWVADRQALLEWRVARGSRNRRAVRASVRRQFSRSGRV